MLKIPTQHETTRKIKSLSNLHLIGTSNKSVNVTTGGCACAAVTRFDVAQPAVSPPSRIVASPFDDCPHRPSSDENRLVDAKFLSDYPFNATAGRIRLKVRGRPVRALSNLIQVQNPINRIPQLEIERFEYYKAQKGMILQCNL